MCKASSERCYRKKKFLSFRFLYDKFEYLQISNCNLMTVIISLSTKLVILDYHHFIFQKYSLCISQ